MNATQARRLATLLEDLVHPHRDPWGRAYDNGDLTEPDLTAGRSETAAGATVLLVEFRVPRESATWRDTIRGRRYLHTGSCELGITRSGALVAWSMLDIPEADYDAEMLAERARREEMDEPPPVFELECWRHVTPKWVVHTSTAGGGLRWVFDLVEGRPLVDPLPGFRAARDAQKGPVAA